MGCTKITGHVGRAAALCFLAGIGGCARRRPGLIGCSGPAGPGSSRIPTLAGAPCANLPWPTYTLRGGLLHECISEPPRPGAAAFVTCGKYARQLLLHQHYNVWKQREWLNSSQIYAARPPGPWGRLFALCQIGGRLAPVPCILGCLHVRKGAAGRYVVCLALRSFDRMDLRFRVLVVPAGRQYLKFPFMGIAHGTVKFRFARPDATAQLELTVGRPDRATHTLLIPYATARGSGCIEAAAQPFLASRMPWVRVRLRLTGPLANAAAHGFRHSATFTGGPYSDSLVAP